MFNPYIKCPRDVLILIQFCLRLHKNILFHFAHSLKYNIDILTLLSIIKNKH